MFPSVRPSNVNLTFAQKVVAQGFQVSQAKLLCSESASVLGTANPPPPEKKLLR